MKKKFFFYKHAKINLQNSHNILAWKFWKKKIRESWLIVLPLRLSCISSHCVSTWPGHLLRPSQPIHPHPHSIKLSVLDGHSRPQKFLLPKTASNAKLTTTIRLICMYEYCFEFQPHWNFWDFLEKFGGWYKNKVFKKKVLKIKDFDQELDFYCSVWQ